MTERLAGKQEVDRNDEAFSLLREELSRSLMLIRKHHFDHLVRLTDFAERTISAAEGATELSVVRRIAATTVAIRPTADIGQNLR